LEHGDDESDFSSYESDEDSDFSEGMSEWDNKNLNGHVVLLQSSSLPLSFSDRLSEFCNANKHCRSNTATPDSADNSSCFSEDSENGDIDKPCSPMPREDSRKGDAAYCSSSDDEATYNISEDRSVISSSVSSSVSSNSINEAIGKCGVVGIFRAAKTLSKLHKTLDTDLQKKFDIKFDKSDTKSYKSYKSDKSDKKSDEKSCKALTKYDKTDKISSKSDKLSYLFSKSDKKSDIPNKYTKQFDKSDKIDNKQGKKSYKTSKRDKKGDKNSTGADKMVFPLPASPSALPPPPSQLFSSLSSWINIFSPLMFACVDACVDY
jgi:hypothetical protein